MTSASSFSSLALPLDLSQCCFIFSTLPLSPLPLSWAPFRLFSYLVALATVSVTPAALSMMVCSRPFLFFSFMCASVWAHVEARV